MTPAQLPSDPVPHIPVLLRPLLDAVAPVTGTWLDGTFGAGGYARGLLDAGANHVFGVDRDPMVFAMAADWADDYGDRLTLVEGTFGQLDTYSDAPLDGVVLDLGVSSMQLDQAERGFSFMKDGPLDMRMGGDGPSAAELINSVDEAALADILFQYGEERASRRIARAIIAKRDEVPIVTTLQLADIIETCLPRSKPGQSHPATRSFQAIRIAVNDEFGELIAGLEAAERALAPDGWLAVVSFHSMEDRVIKKFLQTRSGAGGGGSRHAPEIATRTPSFRQDTRRAITADDRELAANPRARSAKLRLARRSDAPVWPQSRSDLGLPGLVMKGRA